MEPCKAAILSLPTLKLDTKSRFTRSSLPLAKVGGGRNGPHQRSVLLVSRRKRIGPVAILRADAAILAMDKQFGATIRGNLLRNSDSFGLSFRELSSAGRSTTLDGPATILGHYVNVPLRHCLSLR